MVQLVTAISLGLISQYIHGQVSKPDDVEQCLPRLQAP